MPISEELLDILCCPETKVPVKMLTPDQIKTINQAIQTNEIKYIDGTTVDKTLKEGLITIDGQRVYRIDDSIPIMLIDKGIPANQINDLK